MCEFEGWNTWIEPAFLLWKPDDPGYEKPKYNPDKAKFSPEEELAEMHRQVSRSNGFDIDFSCFRCVFNYHSAYLDSDEFVDEPETTGDLLKRLSEESLKDYNQEAKKAYKFVKVVKANFHYSAGIMFLITFEVIDPYDELIKLFQTRVRHAKNIFTEYVFCRPKPDQEVEYVWTVKEGAQKDVKRQRLE